MKKLFNGVFFLLFSATAFHYFPTGTANIRSGYTPQTAPFSVKFKNEVSPYQITSVFLLPGEKTQISLETEAMASVFVLSGATNGWQKVSETKWSYTAPKKSGLYPVRFTKDGTTDSVLINVFVMVPLHRVKNGMLNGYKIGSYPSVPAAKKTLYNLPAGFIEVTKENRDTLISPHFRLKQFLCKQEGAYPKYVVLQERLPLKLEALMEGLNRHGVPCRSLSIMSGYRTPHYNRILGNVKYSRHMWGDAADIFIDSEPGENYMADLNGDGKRDVRDGDVLYRVLNDLDQNPALSRYAGGLAKYKPTRSHGPFVHVDARGSSKRWGN